MIRIGRAPLLLVTAIVRYLGQLIVLLMIGRVDGPLALGQFTLALALLAPLFALSSFGMRQLILTHRKTVRLVDYELFRVGTSSLMLLAVCVWSRGLAAELADMVRLVALFKALESLMEVYQAALIARSRESSVLRWSVLLTCAQTSSFLVAVLVRTSMIESLAWSYGVYSVVLLAGMRPSAATASSDGFGQGAGSSRPEAFKAIFKAGLPVGVALFLLSMLSSFPQWMLGFSGNVIDVGRFAVLSYALVAVEMVLNALSQTWLVSARSIETEGRLRPSFVLRAGAHWLAIVGPIMALGVSGIGLVGPLVFGAAYRYSVLELFTLAAFGSLIPFVFSTANGLLLKNAYLAGMICSALALIGSGGTAGIIWISSHSFGLFEAVISYGVGLVLRAGASSVALLWIDRLTTRQWC